MDERIDTTDIPEAGEAWFKAARLVLPKCEHTWDGPTIPIKHGWSATCPKCGLDAYSWSLWGENG